MNNFNNCENINLINSQLKRAEKQKGSLLRNIYREYELYLSLVRELIYISVEKGLYELHTYLSIKDNLLNPNDFYCLFEKKISKLIFNGLPLLTVEQLKIIEIEKNLNKGIISNDSDCSTKKLDDQKEKIQIGEGSQLEKTIQLQFSEDIRYSSDYYPAENHEKCLSLDLDNTDHNNYLSNNKIIEQIGLEKQFIASLFELIEKANLEKISHSGKDKINQMDTLSKHQSLNIFDLIDNSLENWLMNLSYKINEELFKANLIKKMISKDSFDYLVDKNLMIKHPYPFVIDFELNLNRSQLNVNNLPSIIFFNISTVELEFENLNLSIQRNKINELKNQFQRLIKKKIY